MLSTPKLCSGNGFAMEYPEADHQAARFQIPGYRLLEKLGEGGMGAVYRAASDASGGEVAIKVLTPDQSIRAFRRETQLMASLAHPHLVAIHACGETADRYYLVMEYIAGSSLRTRMTPGRPWPLEQAIDVVTAIGQALAYMHGQGVLHLDLKPENVLCGAAGQIKVTDFGLSQPRVDAARPAGLEVAQGTVDYCAPEQRYGLPVDPRADLFALGTLTYELLAGRLPGRVFAPARRANPDLPPALDDVLRQALARDRDERQATIEEFVQALRRAAEASEAN
jgi:serine/threonine protein kinase